jgi:hypothetical protein
MAGDRVKSRLGCGCKLMKIGLFWDFPEFELDFVRFPSFFHSKNRGQSNICTIETPYLVFGS